VSGNEAAHSRESAKTKTTPKIGDTVIFHDSKGRAHHALVIAVFGETTLYDGVYDEPCMNLVYVSSDPKRQDSYGRQIERDPSSVVHASHNHAHGNYWRRPDEEPNPIVKPNEE
jgi:hypothetical protein